jgi:hypothetical protein
MQRTWVMGIRETWLRKTLWAKRKEITGGWENYTKVSFMVFILHRKLLG